MSFDATKWGWEQLNISSTEKLVLLDLCDRANANNVCWPRQRTIANRTRLTERTVCSALAKLESLKLIHRRSRLINGRRTSDWITLVIGPPAPPPADAPPANPPPANDPPPPNDLPRSTRQSEVISCDHQNVLREPTGKSFSVICNDEPPRLKQTIAHFLEPFPEPGRPDLEAIIYAARTIDEIATELGPAIDWSAPGINNLAPIATWLRQLDEQEVRSCLIEIAQRVSNGPGRIGSWKYFEEEILKSCRQENG
jgi:hypothetical protein